MKKIELQQGSGTILLGIIMMMLSLLFMVFIIVNGNIQYCKTVAQTRSDAIADSTAVYAQSYDYKYNQPHAELMTELLTKKNNELYSFFEIQTNLTFPDPDRLTVECYCEMPLMYKSLAGQDKAKALASTTVKSVDIYGDIIYIPDLQ